MPVQAGTDLVLSLCLPEEIGPFAGAIYPGHNTPEGLAARRQVNDWIRTSDTFDSVFDVADAVADPARPDHIPPEFDSGDGIHLNDAGAHAMAAPLDLNALRLSTCRVPCQVSCRHGTSIRPRGRRQPGKSARQRAAICSDAVTAAGDRHVRLE
ncbi:hypothetical protein MOV08_02075 [Streptomyces yunnanensis]|uniref:GDSL-like Lipase/Acylhydrolase family protein n=1 Tax=Streptomyces yunnanensis TaxID=156453 RepID=A0ABY8A1N6_9ACTN|nr:hypothetical protein [Streptomyces yunnanensis]WEB38211.1 hypothetical protein MOV08_02075 [Streptomyces yunnanensis]